MILNIDPESDLGRSLRRHIDTNVSVNFFAHDRKGVEKITSGILHSWTIHKGCVHVPDVMETTWVDHDEWRKFLLPALP